jgi:hypothetical protein
MVGIGVVSLVKLWTMQAYFYYKSPLSGVELLQKRYSIFGF